MPWCIQLCLRIFLNPPVERLFAVFKEEEDIEKCQAFPISLITFLFGPQWPSVIVSMCKANVKANFTCSESSEVTIHLRALH